MVSTRRTASMSAVLQAASMAAKAKLARGFDFDTAASIHPIKSRSKTAGSPELKSSIGPMKSCRRVYIGQVIENPVWRSMAKKVAPSLAVQSRCRSGRSSRRQLKPYTRCSLPRAAPATVPACYPDGPSITSAATAAVQTLGAKLARSAGPGNGLTSIELVTDDPAIGQTPW